MSNGRRLARALVVVLDRLRLRERQQERGEDRRDDQRDRPPVGVRERARHRVAHLERQVRARAAEAGVAPPPPRRSRSATVRITDMTAVPIEAPTCWMMFSVVLARAIWTRRSVCSAPVISGIIEKPMPMPITNRTPLSVQ